MEPVCKTDQNVGPKLPTPKNLYHLIRQQKEEVLVDST